MTQTDLMRTGFVFGTLEGWWLSTEEFRPDGPCVSEETWNMILTQNGFSGVDLLIRDTNDPTYHEYSVMVSTQMKKILKSQGQKAACLRLGIMSDIGIISENPEMFENRDHMVETASVIEVEFLALFDHYCNPNNPLGPLTPQESLPMIGLLTPSQFLSQGLEALPWAQTPTFSTHAYIGLGDTLPTSAKATHIDFGAQPRAVESADQAKEVVLTAVAMKLAKALGIDLD
ncbi:hypothetical protein DSL72_008123 [Monilinia vaccinii-corymbosi]|uniref:Uncharacterized protein n=1 Tax=Monilinia vaccinii-corymbosi TaxID=61207 RepID=A0A8A3PJU9_9HELO|nr:hypothetical protein DSL72_008123 [Monilinia vaccinii-corymbosi]